MANRNLLLIFVIVSFFVYSSLSQPLKTTCNGVFLSYNYTGGYPIPPTDPTNQPYRFESTVTVLNNGRDELKSWSVFVGFQNNEVLVSATNALLADGRSLPAFVGNGTVLVGSSNTDLKSAIETAGDLTQMEVIIQLVGTRFGNRNGTLDAPLPLNLTLANDGYSCPSPTRQGNELQLCCTRDLNAPSNITLENFQPRKDGDLIIMYDIIRTYETDYWAQVSISNHNPLGRLDNWKLSWDWTRGEFIYAMKGAYPSVVDTTGCVFGPQGQHYKEMDFSQALNCERSPTIVDLPPTRANDTQIGLIPFCCRNGTILPPNMDPMQLDKAGPGFEKAYSFNGSVLPNSSNIIFMQGLPDFNYLVAEMDGANPRKDPRVPGTQQSVLSFTKKKTPGIDVADGDGFPMRVFFNGEECALPTIRPTNNGRKAIATNSAFSSLLVLALFLMYW
ncbi:hypothetical protein GH714_037737 [Hevea brasiliensis]|uniref:COBRA-like protein n=1 Tax=Hevea brasiliensis TaxID=3981 RepID=A0A6A6LTJ8_HEVBR|nr:hypothetical protein GH714_037737 [Hevea brasiliensis]